MRQHQRTTSASLPAQVLQHVSWRRHGRNYVIAGVILFVVTTIWIHGGAGIAVDGFRPGPQPQGHLPSPDKLGFNGKTHAPSLTKATQTVIRSSVPSKTGQSSAHVLIQTPAHTATTTHASESATAATKTSAVKAAHPTPSSGSHIPPKIWQILLPKQKGDTPAQKPEDLEEARSWMTMNPDHEYTLIGQSAADAFVRSHFSHTNPALVELYSSLPNVGMKSDLLRYLLLSIHGGIYSDTDTLALKPIPSWVPPSLQPRVNLIVGIEFDRRDGGGWVDITHWVQLCQWTIAAAPGHPVFTKMAQRVQQSIAELSEAYRLPVSDLKPTSYEVMNSTGPAAWTDVVFEMLRGYDESLKDTKDLAFMTEPRLIGDILVLPVDGFGMGQMHSNSTNDGTVPEQALVKHLFKGGWREE